MTDTNMKKKSAAKPQQAADKLAGIVQSIAKADTHSPNVAMPPPQFFAEYAKADPDMPKFFKQAFADQLVHERRMERLLARRHFHLHLLELLLPLICVLSTAYIIYQTQHFVMSTIFAGFVAGIYGVSQWYKIHKQ